MAIVRFTIREIFEIEIICRKTQKKLKGGFLVENKFQKKVAQCRKKIEREDPLVSPGNVCYAEKRKKILV